MCWYVGCELCDVVPKIAHGPQSLIEVTLVMDGSGNPIYVDPHGCSYSSEELVPLALAAFEEEKQSGTRGATLRILKHSLGQLREGAHEERIPVSEIASIQKLQDDPEGTDVCGDHLGHMKKILSK